MIGFDGRVLRPLLPPRLIGALLRVVVGLTLGLLLGAVGAVAAPAYAAEPCPRPDVASSAKSARAVLTGTVQDSVKVVSDAGATFTHDVEVERVYKGPVPSSEAQVQTDGSSGGGACTLGRLETGETYLFFLQLDGDLWIATGSGGTELATTEAVGAVEDLLGAGTPAVPPTPETAEFTSVAGGEPVSVSRAAAPGIALVLIGLLGLIVVGRLGRR